MKLLSVFLFVLCLQVSAGGNAQVITLSVKDAPLTKVLNEIEKQSGYSFIYGKGLINRADKVSLDVKNEPVENLLKMIFQNQPLAYKISEKFIVLSPAPVTTAPVKLRETEGPPPIDVRGRITNENGEPVAGASVVVKGTKMGTTTNENGEYILTGVNENATLVISGTNIETIEVKVNGRMLINVTAKIAVKEEEIVVAYGTRTRTNNVGALTVVKGEQVQTLPNRSVDKSLQGLVPGLFVTPGTGQPGGGIANFVLRGIATGDKGERGSTLRNPLIVVDGVPVSQEPQQLYVSITDPAYTNPMAQLNPSDIETITVLKDAAAIALFGSKAANGVILITTKRGKSGKTQFTFRHQTDFAHRLEGKVKMLNQQQYLELLYETYRNSIPGISDADILADLQTIFPTRSDGSWYPEERLADQVYTDNASTLTNELSASGGSDKSNFYFNIEWTKQNGVYKKAGYDRKSIRFNFENRPTSWLHFGTNIGLSYNVQGYPDLSNDPNIAAVQSSPLQPIRDENGKYFYNYPYYYNATNPVAALEYNTNNSTSYRGLTKLYAGLSFLRHFKFTTNLGVDYNMTESKEKYDPRLFDPVSFSIGSGRIEEGALRSIGVITTNTFVFEKNLANASSLNVLLGQEAQIATDRRIKSIGSNFLQPYFNQVDNTPVRSGYGSGSKITLVSYFAQVNYGYAEKYFGTVSGRVDGSSKFGQDKQYGGYWSIGGGWILSKERFLQPVKWIDYLKIRGSIGVAGNSGAIDRYTRYNRLQSNVFQNTIAVFPLGSPANPDIKWEQTFSWDAGLEAKLWDNRISLTLDVYRRKTSDMIYLLTLAPITGYNNMLANIGDMENKGTEVSVSFDILKARDFKWNISANWSTNKNKLLRADVNLSKLTSGYLANKEGQNFNSFYMRRWAGVNPVDGSSQFIDSTGKADSDYNAAKEEFVGKPQPDGFGAFTNSLIYKRWQFSFLLYYQYGFQVYDNYALMSDGSEPYTNQDVRALDRWQNPGDIASNPKRTLYGSDGYYISTRRLYDGDFIRLQNISLRYSLPEPLIKKLHLTFVQLLAQAHNVGVWTKFKGADLSNTNVMGNAIFNYPNARTFSFGLTVGF